MLTSAWLALSLAASAPAERGADPLGTVRTAVGQVCLPYVADERPLAEVERAAGLRRVWRIPDPIGARTGVDYERVGPGQRSLTLFDNLGRRVRGWRGLRACELQVDAPATAVAEVVLALTEARGDFRTAALVGGENPGLHLCGRGLEPVNVVVTGPAPGRTLVAVHKRPGEGSPCPAR